MEEEENASLMRAGLDLTIEETAQMMLTGETMDVVDTTPLNNNTAIVQPLSGALAINYVLSSPDHTLEYLVELHVKGEEGLDIVINHQPQALKTRRSYC